MIVRVRRFGGARVADPPAWALWSEKDRDTVEIFFGLPDALLGTWNVDRGGNAWWPVAEAYVPDTVWAALAAWRLTC